MTKAETESENASVRKTYISRIYDIGEKIRKDQVIEELPTPWKKLHEEGYVHIHDLEAYGNTYNCLMFNLLNKFPYNDFRNHNDISKILGVFEHYKNIIVKIGNEQSGGMGFANFDCDTAIIFQKIGIADNECNREIIRSSIDGFIRWCNNSHERMGQASYYVTLNIGLADNDLAHFICKTVIEEFDRLGGLVFKPNIIFKVKMGVNRFPENPNFDLYEKALLCTAKKMIPTFVLGDSVPNKDVDIKQLAIMGCRTRVIQNLHGAEGSIGRGNISNITINLPRIAFEVTKENLKKNE